MRLDRHFQLMETVDRALVYARIDRPRRDSLSVVYDACSTMCFDPTGEEQRQMTEMVERQRLPSSRPRR